jgi:hypothetical protein
MNSPANLAEKLAAFTDRFSPRTVATYNNSDIMVAKLEGPFSALRPGRTSRCLSCRR